MPGDAEFRTASAPRGEPETAQMTKGDAIARTALAQRRGFDEADQNRCVSDSLK